MNMPSKKELVGLAVGAVIGYLFRNQFAYVIPGAGTVVYSTGTYLLTQGDVIVMGAGAVLAVIGQKAHPILRWVGIGIVAVYGIQEIMEFASPALVTP